MEVVAARVAAVGLACLLLWTLVLSVAAGATERKVPPIESTRALRRPRPRIVNGILTPSYPTAGALLLRDDSTGPESVSTTCSGTLIGCQTFLTAAHCVCPDDVDTGTACLAAGVTDPSTLSVFLQHGGFFPVSSVAIDPAYEFKVASDVAVIKLATPVSGIAPVRINTTRAPTPGTVGTIVGFGISADDAADAGLKRVGRVVTAPCEGSVPDTTHVCWSFVQPVGLPGQDSNTCQGDSGGPLFIDFGSGDTLVGVTSGGEPGCRPNSTSWDAAVFYERFWIQTEVGTDLDNTTCGGLPPAGAAGTQITPVSGELSSSQPEARSTFRVQAGTTLLRIALNGQDEDTSVRPSLPNDFDLYVKAGSPPTTSDYDCRDISMGPYGFCEINAPAAGTWYVLVDLAEGGGTYQVTATTYEAAAAACVGDCNVDGAVTVDEIVKGVNVALGSLLLDQCGSFDSNSDGAVTIDELVRAVNNALTGCPAG